MFCVKCGKKNNDDDEFCSGCGIKINSETIVEQTDKDNGKTAVSPQNGSKTQGNIKKIIDAIIERKGKGNTLLIIELKKKLVFKGINPNKYTYITIDDPVIMGKLLELVRDLGFKI